MDYLTYVHSDAFRATAYMSMAIVALISLYRCTGALDMILTLRRMRRDARSYVDGHMPAEALDPRLHGLISMLLKEETDEAAMRSIEEWVAEGIHQMILPHRHRLALLRRTGPQLGLVFTLFALVIGLSIPGENGTATALLTTLGPALITTAIGSCCVVVIGAVESALEWAAETTEHEVIASLRLLRFQKSLADEQDAA